MPPRRQGRSSGPRLRAPPLVGRADDLQWLERALRDPAPLVSLVGPPGIGKTSLALGAAAALASTGHLDAVWVCPLERATDAGSMHRVIAQALGLIRGPGAWPDEERLAVALSLRRRALVVVDGVDRVRDAVVAEVARWRAASPELAVIVTARKPLRLPGERVRQVDLPEPAVLVDLFLGWTRRWRPELRVTVADRSALADRMAQLGSVLAVKLAASQVRALPADPGPEAWSRWLEPGLPAEGTTGVRGLGTVARWAFAGLEPRLQHVLSRVALFPGGAGARQLRYVLNATPPVEVEPLDDVVAELRAAGWLEVLPGPAPRIRLVHALRGPALDHVGAGGGSGTVPEALARAICIAVVTSAERDRVTLDGRAALAIHDDNLILAAHLAAPRHPGLVARAAACLAPSFRAFGTARAELDLLEQTHDVAQKAGPALLARHLIATSDALRASGRLEGAAQAAEDAVRRARKATDRVAEIHAQLRVARCFASLGLRHRANGRLDEALATATALGDADLLARVQASWARGGRARGFVDPAVDFYAQAAAVLGAGGDTACQARVLTNLGLVLVDTGRMLEAEETLQTAYAVARDLRRSLLGVAASYDLAVVLFRSGREAEAERAFGHALGALGRVRSPVPASTWWTRLAILRHLRGHAQAAELYDRGIDHAVHAGDRWLLATALAFRGAFFADAGDRDRARRDLGWAQQLLGRAALVERAVVDALHGNLDLLAMRRAPEDALGRRFELYQRARQRLGRIPDDLDAPHLRAARAVVAAAVALAPVPPARLELGPSASWFTLGALERVSLREHPDLRTALMQLYRQRVHAPGVAVASEELAASVWPERAFEDEPATRIDDLIDQLGALGLGLVLRHVDGGYLLDERVEVGSSF